MNGVIKVAAAAWCREPKKRCLFPSQCLAHCSCSSSCWLAAQEGCVPTSQELLPAPQCSATTSLNSHFISPVSPSLSLLKEVVFYFSHRDVVGASKNFESCLQFLRWHQWNSQCCIWLEIQGGWLDSSHESGFPPTSSGHGRDNQNSLVCCAWMKMPGSSGMIIFISESFQSVLGWMRFHQDEGLLSTSLSFLGVALFPREGTHRSKALGALGAASIPGRALASLSCPLQLGNMSWYGRAGEMSPHAHLLCCGFLRVSIELHSPLLVGFFFVVVGFFVGCFFFFNWSTRSGTETINSFHWQSHSQLKSAAPTSASTEFYLLHQLSQLLWERRFMCCDMREHFF